MGGVLNPKSLKKALNPFKAPAHTGGLIGFDEPFRQGTSSAKRQVEEQKRMYDAQLAQAKADADKQANVAKAQARLEEDRMFEGGEEGLGVEQADLSDVGGKRKRRRVQATGSGLGI